MGLFSAPTTTQQTSPFGGSGALNDALNLYKKKQLNPYVKPSSTTMDSLASYRKQASNVRAPLNQSLARFTSFANGSGDVGSSQQDNIYSKAMGPSMSEQNLGGVAHGDFVGHNDPNYDIVRKKALEDAATEAGMVASGMGRTGSDYHQDAVARQVGETGASMDMARLKEEQDRQFQANSLIDSLRQSGWGQALNAANSSTAIQSGNQDRRFNANAAIPGAAQATLAPYGNMLGIGQAYDADAAAKAGTPGSNLSSLLQLLQGYGTQTNTEPSNKAGMLAGGGLGLLSLLAQM